MCVTLLYDTGIRVDAILLAVGPDRMRLVANDQDDPIELRLINRCWIADTDNAVEFEAMIAVPFCHMGDLHWQARAAGVQAA